MSVTQRTTEIPGAGRFPAYRRPPGVSRHPLGTGDPFTEGGLLPLLPPQRQRAQQIVHQRVQQRHSEHFLLPAYTYLIQTAVPCPRVGPLRRLRAQFVGLSSVVCSHALPPGRHSRAIVLPRLKGIDSRGFLLFRALDRSEHLDLVLFVHAFNVVQRGVAAVDQSLLRWFTVTLYQLFDHRGQLAAIPATVRRVHADDDTAFRRRG